MSGENIVGKVILDGTLETLSPLLIGDGESAHESGEQDISILRNDKDEPFIPGTSLIGVLREILEAQYPEKVAQIFGDLDAMQSSIQAEDMVFPATSAVVERNGVAIDSYLGTAVPHARYDYEALERGAQTSLHLIFTLRGIHTEDAENWRTSAIKNDVLELLRFLRDRLEEGIHLGANTAKGFGRVRLHNAKLGLFDFRKKAAVKQWLGKAEPMASDAPCQLQEPSKLPKENPQTFTVRADFALQSSLLVRDYQSINGKNIAVMLKSKEDAVIPGTTIKGVLRHRAEKIAFACGYPKEWFDDLFGTAEAQNSKNSATEGRKKSRLTVEESYLSLDKKGDLLEREVTRNRIDRFTGGTIKSALFTTKPLYQTQKDKATVKICFAIQQANKAEAGLALFLLKDLWQGTLSLGGEAGVGRGTLQGLQATIQYQGKTYQLNQAGQVTKGDAAQLEACATAFAMKEGA